MIEITFLNPDKSPITNAIEHANHKKIIIDQIEKLILQMQKKASGGELL